MNLFLMHLFVDDARDLVSGATLGTPVWYRPVLAIPFTPAPRHGKTRYLVAVLESPGPFAFITDERPFEGARAPERFAALAGRRVAGWERASGDRVIRIDADPGPRDTPGAVSLWLHLYGARGSAILQRDDTRLEAVGARRPEDWSPSRRRTLVDVSADALDTSLSLTAVDGAHSPRALVPGLERELVDAFTDADGRFDAVAVTGFRDAVISHTQPFVLAASRKAGNAVPVPERAAGTATGGGVVAGPFTSALEGCRALGDIILGSVKTAMIRDLAQPIHRKLAANVTLLEHLEADLEAARGHERIRREAENMAAYQSTIRPGAGSLEVTDIYDSGTTLRIELDPSLPVRKQIEKRFKKAAKLEKSAAHTRRRIELVTREIAELSAATRLLEAESSLASALTHVEVLRERFAIAPRAPRDRGPRPRTPEPGDKSGRDAPAGRRFDLGEGWYALVGRNNRDNDDLTFHHAAPGDLWFHAQSVPGSHVLLKTSRPSGDPSGRIIEATASLAAHFSKARHSRLVPVIYTRRKYVRKFRGAKPGQVVCEREKMVMVPPRLPDSPSE